MIIKNSLDTSNYKYLVLNNMIKTILVSNQDFNQASCSLAVGVGSHNNPSEYLGLAHFLEHMLFLGSQKYPIENEFAEFLSKHNGKKNAYTTYECTVYYCEIDAKHLNGMADRFSSFFTCPLLKKESMARELNAVHSEYENGLNSKERRIYSLLNEFSKKTDPRGKFTCGNKSTLEKNDIWERVFEFWETYYSSDSMTLVICGKESLKELEEISQYFSTIPNKNLNGILFNPKFESLCYFDESYYNHVIQGSALNDKKELWVTINIQPCRSLFKTNPLEYLDFLLKNNEKNLLLSNLKTQDLAVDIKINYHYFHTFTRVMISIDLTNKGRIEYKKILEMLIIYLNQIGIDQYEYLRLKRFKEEEFRCLQYKSPVFISKELARNLLFFPHENVYNYQYVFENFDKNIISNVLDQVADHQKWMIVLSDSDGEFNQKETYFSVNYKVLDKFEFKFEPASIKSLRKINICENFENESKKRGDSFISTYELIKKADSRFYCKNIFDNGEICYVFDQKLKIPKSRIQITLNGKEAKENLNALKLFLEISKDQFKESYSRQFKNYHLEMNARMSYSGVIITFEGFSDKLPEACIQYLKTINNVDLSKFDVFKKRVEDIYAEIISKSPFMRLEEMVYKNFFGLPTSNENLEDLKKLKVEDVKFISEYYSEILAIGNIELEEVQPILNTLKGTDKKPKPLKGLYLKDFKFLVQDNSNNLVSLIFEVVDFKSSKYSLSYSDKLKLSAIGQLIFHICRERFFNELRTQEKLGYVCFCYYNTVISGEYLSFNIQSNKSVDFLKKRLLDFVQDAKIRLNDMTEEEFAAFKGGLIASFKEPITDFESLSMFCLNQYRKGEIDLDLKEKMINIVENLCLDDLRASGVLVDHYFISSYRAD